MNASLIKFFKSATASSPLVSDTEALQKEALKRGFLIHPDILNEDVAAFVATETIDPNSTFYRTWEDVASKDRFQLLIDQLIHYAFTYGSDYTLDGNGYVPNEGAETPDFREYTLIQPISEERLYERCSGLITSGVALKSETVKAVCSFITEYLAARPEVKLDIDVVKNREALSVLASALGIRPSDPVALLRFMVYESTGETLLIKSPELIRKIHKSEKPFDFNLLDEVELDSLATVFYRFKDIFLAFRSHETKLYDTEKKEMVKEPTPSRPVINKIRRKAVSLHIPLKKGFWETILASRRTIEEVRERLASLSSFRLVSLLQTVRERLAVICEEYKRMYLIRNGKTFVNTVEKGEYKELEEYYSTLAAMFEDRLVEILSPKACTVRFPAQVTLTCPSSEKNFIGNYPFGSWYSLSENNFFGIYWRNEWGARDFDISFVDLSGRKTGWNAEYNTGATLYSGDLTNADPEASEIHYCKGLCPDGIVFCNRYNGEVGSRFRFFFGQEEIVDLKRGYMVDPNNMAVNEDVVSGPRQTMLAAVCAGKIFLMSLAVGDSRVSSGSDAADKVAILSRMADSFLELKPLLLKAGFTEAGDGETPSLDLSDVNKDTLINLFSD